MGLTPLRVLAAPAPVRDTSVCAWLGAFFASQQAPRERKLIVPCPPEMVKHIIGRGGDTIRKLQESSHAHIFVNQVGQWAWVGVRTGVWACGWVCACNLSWALEYG